MNELTYSMTLENVSKSVTVLNKACTIIIHDGFILFLQ